MSHLDRNRRAWDELTRIGQRHTTPAKDEEFAAPLAAINGDGWLGDSIVGKHVLCLAAGGGRHGPLYAAAGAFATVVDLSPAMLEHDRRVAAERKLSVRVVETSMEDLSMFAAGEFDLVVQPVSTCYVPDVAPVYRQIARIVRPGGVYVSQHKQPTSLQCTIRPNAAGRYELSEPYYHDGALPPATEATPHREPGTYEYVHRWSALLGELCRAGFAIEDVAEPSHAKDDAAPGSFGERSRYVAPYLRLKARRRSDVATTVEPRKLWLADDVA